MPEMKNLLNTRVQEGPIKFNLKLEATYSLPSVLNSLENRAFKTSALEIFKESNITEILERVYIKLLVEEEEYRGRGSGFRLHTIDGLLLAVYKYTPMGGSSYIDLPQSIKARKATINPQNIDEQCFKWAILARHVTGLPLRRVGENYIMHEDEYNFEGIKFPTPMADIKIFEANNRGVSVNVYGLTLKTKNLKYPKYEVFPLRVIDEEKPNHFDLLLLSNASGAHYVYISNFSRLVSPQKNNHDGLQFFCKRCFTSFDKRSLKYKLNGEAALNNHKLICGPHKPILPEMPKAGECVKFETWRSTQRHPIVIYADFEALLVKIDEKKGKKTTIVQRQEAMSYGFIVKASDNVPLELLADHGITMDPVIYRGSEDRPDVAKHFVEAIVEVSRKIETLLKTNTPIIMTEEQEKTHQECTVCNLCKCNIVGVDKVRDHDHQSGKFRQTLCFKCNLTLQQPKFVPVFFHNLSNYDSHYIISQLGFDSNSITVIPNSEEKFISFSKYVSNKFTVRFIDTFRLMATSLGKLAANMITPLFENFRETA
ncbi:uncharacterized protein LOC111026302 [Myzus persicae]|uniref:uncharacterized protein LOC111026302 n=1 Tax=Myzus persicae TaxID=13164 RepID=UPI000B93933C|nr:uncharacterized protein LOC111026302 [Myzus persicae]